MARPILARMRFTGARFDEHALPVDLMPDIVAFRDLLKSVAEALWRRRHPGRRLPRGFSERFRLDLISVRSGSSVVSFAARGGQRQLENARGEDWANLHQEALFEIQELLSCLGRGGPFPTSFPTACVRGFQAFGANLGEDEVIHLLAGRRRTGVTYTPVLRQRVMEYVPETYEDVIECVVRVTALDVERRVVVVRPDEDSQMKWEAPYRERDEAVLLDALTHSRSKRVLLRARAEYREGSDSVFRLVEVSLARPYTEWVYDSSAASLRSLAEQAFKDVPPEAWNDVPVDGATNVDQYLYGTPE